jgi:hypothetical protein
VADETIPQNSEIIFSDFYEISAPFASEIGPGSEMQVGTVPDIGSASPFLPGYEIGYDQITSSGIVLASTTESAGTLVIQATPHTFDGAPVMVEFFSPNLVAFTQSCVLCLFEGTTEIGQLAFITINAAATLQISGGGRLRFTPTAGTHTYKVTGFSSGASGGEVASGVGGTGALLPSFLRFTKV